MLHIQNKKIVFFQSEGRTVKLFDGSKHYECTEQQKMNQIVKPFNYSDILVPYSGKEEEQEQKYKEFIEGIEAVKKLSNGKINMYRTGSISNTSHCLFNQLNKIKPAPIEPFEFDYIHDCGGGARIVEPYEGDIFKYDIISYYPSLLNSKTLKIPVTAGTITPITQEELDDMAFVKYGIYHVNIDVKNPKLFTRLSSNRYTHYEVNRAKQLKYTITVQGPALLWDTSTLKSARDIFGKYVDYLFNLKGSHPFFKQILNSLWGKLVSSRRYYTLKSTMEDLDVPTGSEITKIIPRKDGLFDFRITNNTSYAFKTNHARLKPFLMGYGRIKLHQAIQKVGHQYVKYSHTDSMITSKRIPSKIIKCGSGLGDWKFEETYKANIINGANIKRI